MKLLRYLSPVTTLSLLTVISLASITTATARPIEDNSLGAESSVVNRNVVNGIDLITGGATRGSNLFHSFQEFNIDAGRGAYFSNPAGIANILTRVTGGNPSNILGRLGVLGNANLFLINPKGIFFGPNASLDLRGGSFFGTTAGSVLFDNFEFSTSNPQAIPQLTINIPIGLRFRDNPASINSNASLAVQTGKSLALIGGDVSLNGGTLVASGGRVEVGGLAQPGTVGFNADGSLTFPNSVTRGNVTLGNGASLSAIGQGGSIATNGANLFTVTFGFEGENGPANAGDIEVNTSDFVNIDNSVLVSRSRGEGNAGNINITARSLSVTNGGQLLAETYNKGNAGNVTINAPTGTVSFDGTNNAGFPSAVFTTVEAGGEGKGGDINITANSLSLTNGAQLNTFIRGNSNRQPGGIGDAGNVKLNITDTVNIAGISNQRNSNGNFIRSGIFSNVENRARGNAGNIEIAAGSLFVTNGGRLVSSTSGQGNAGGIKINANSFVLDAAQLNTNSNIENRQAGNIDITTTKDIRLNNGALIKVLVVHLCPSDEVVYHLAQMMSLAVTMSASI